LHPWDDPFTGGFQLTPSLIAIAAELARSVSAAA